jgi:hypothetical protein
MSRLFVFIFIVVNGISQEKINSRIYTTGFFTTFHEATYSGLSLGYGMEFNEFFVLGTSINLHAGRTSYVGSEQMVNLHHSLFVQYRPFKNFKLSPKIHCEGGYQLYTNGKGMYVDDNFSLHDDFPNPNTIYTYGILQNFGPFCNGILSLSIRIKAFDIDLGMGYVIQRLRTSHFYTGNKQTEIFNGKTLNFSVSFRLGSLRKN